MVLGAGVSDGGLLVDVDVPQRHLATAADLLTQALGRAGLPRGRGAPLLPQPARRDRAGAGLRRPTARPRSSPAPSGTPSTGPACPPAARTETVGGAHPRGPRRVPRHRGRPAGATVVVAGDLTGVDVLGVLEGTLGTWSAPRHRPADRARRPRARGRTPTGSSSSTAPARCRPRSPSAGPAPDRSTPDGWAPHPVHLLRARRLPERARRRRAARGEGLHLRHPHRRSGRGSPGGSFVTSGSVRSEVTGEAVEILLGILDARPRGLHRRRAALGGRLRRQDRARPLRHRGCRRRRDRGARPRGAAARLHDPQPARRGRRSTRDDLDEAYRRVATGEWTVVLVGDAATVVPALEGRVDGPVGTVAL